jgi:hypothetical protein
LKNTKAKRARDGVKHLPSKLQALHSNLRTTKKKKKEEKKMT